MIIDLRDYFAAQAMNALLQDSNGPPAFGTTELYREAIAKGSYMVADEMMKWRLKDLTASAPPTTL